MKQLYSYKLESHPGVNLIEHLKCVGNRCEELVKEKDINFSKYTKEEIRNIAKVIGYCHDLGKSTKYFQKYLKKEEVKERLKSHALISSLICFYNLKHINKELAIIAYLVVNHHHGNLKNFTDELTLDKANKKLIIEQYKALDEEINIICDELKLIMPTLDEIVEIFEDIEDELDEYNDDLFENEDFEIYILTKYLFSLLIYSDKEHAIFKDKNDVIYNLQSTLIDDYKLIKFGQPQKNNIREVVYEDVVNNINKTNNRIMSITLPTGTGKTYTCMSTALKLKEKLKKDMKIVYCLPFTSVIDQNYEDYRKAIETVKNKKEATSNDILKHHYLSPKDYNKEELYYEADEGRFLIENWNSQIVVTTFIQMFNTLFSNRNSSLIKFNTLSNSIILLDEVQSIPYKYWKVINLYLKELAEILNIYFIFITATQPLIFEKNDIFELASKSDYYFSQCKRTKLIIQNEPMDKEEFFEYVKDVINKNENKNILIIVNTIKLSQELYKELENEEYERDCIYLSTSIIPKQRKERIDKIKNSINKNIVVSTQMVEAGVDIDMDIVIRDIAPLDSINQSAGRANRENRGEYLGQVHLVKVKNNTQLLAKYVYRDEILLQATETVLEGKEVILEEDYKQISDMYFRELNKTKSNSKSNELIKQMYQLDFEKVENESKLIEDQDKVQVFIETDEDAVNIWSKYKEYTYIKDPFERRNKMESIKVDFYKYVISVFKNKCQENIEYGIGYVSINQIENTYDENFGYKSKEESCVIF